MAIFNVDPVRMCKLGSERTAAYSNGYERGNMIKKSFTIQFPENPVSGFSWDIATSNGLQVTRDRFVPEDEGKIGSGGTVYGIFG